MAFTYVGKIMKKSHCFYDSFGKNVSGREKCVVQAVGYPTI